MSVIGEQIKKIRTEKGITQEQLGELIGVGKKAVLYVSGGRLPLCTEYLLGNRNRTYEGFVDRR